MKKSLAFILRPKTISDIIGQSHLINDKNGVITRMLKYRFVTSLIFYGKPGVGKTSLAFALANDLNLPFWLFNAALDKKQFLEDILAKSQKYEQSIIIIEEIHRMNKDKQDILLQKIEQGHLIMFACTTENPFFVINPALRSRSQIIHLEPISNQEMVVGLEKIIVKYRLPLKITPQVLQTISRIANGDLRIALNIFDLLINLYPKQNITRTIIKAIAPYSNLVQDKDGDEHHDLLSALQKSIRGSDVDGALHYFARLLVGGDFQSLTRRMLVTAYEDIGLANPTIPLKVKAAIDAFFQLGMPEGRIPLGLVIVEMALSEKSNSAYLATDKALHDVTKYGKGLPIPMHLRDSSYKSAKKLGHGKGYKYPHVFHNHYINQQYLPDEIKHVSYYNPETHNLYEKKINQIYRNFTKKS